MNQDYNQSVDIFSAGVALFVMLTHQVPFKAIFKRHGNYAQSKYYSLLLSNIKQYWHSYVGYKTIVDGDAKKLIVKMLAFDQKDRISIKEIMQHEWYLGTSITNGTQLKHHIESLLKQHSNLHQINVPAKQPQIIPLCIDETKANVIFTTKEESLVFDTLQNCIEQQLNGTSVAILGDHLLLCSIPSNSEDSKTQLNVNANVNVNSNYNVKLTAGMYISRAWNTIETIKRCEYGSTNAISNNRQSSSLIDADTIVYTLILREIDGKDEKLAPFKATIMKSLRIVDCKSFEDMLIMPQWQNSITHTMDTKSRLSPTHQEVEYFCSFNNRYISKYN